MQHQEIVVLTVGVLSLGAWFPGPQLLDIRSTKGIQSSQCAAWATKQGQFQPPGSTTHPLITCPRAPWGGGSLGIQYRGLSSLESHDDSIILISWKSRWDSRFWRHKGWLAQTSSLWFDYLFWRVNHVGDKSTLHPFPALLDSNIPPFHQLIYVSRQVCEGLLHVNGVSGWRFNVLHAICSSQFLSLVASHLPLCIQVTLVTHKNEYNLVGLDVYFGLF